MMDVGLNAARLFFALVSAWTFIAVLLRATADLARSERDERLVSKK